MNQSHQNDIQESVENLLKIAENPESADIILPEEEKVKYYLDKIRPMQFDRDVLVSFQDNTNNNESINLIEVKLSNYSSMIGSNIPYWINSYDLYAIAVADYGIPARVSPSNKSSLINFHEIENYKELVEVEFLPAPPDFSQEISKQSWKPNRDLLTNIEQNLNVSIEEHGSCCVPFAFTAETAKNVNGQSVIHMPPSFVFKSEDAYYHTLFHEITHVQLVKDRSLQSAVITDIASINKDQAERVKAKNEIAAELGASILLSVYKSGELPVKLSDYSNAYMNSHGVSALTKDERQEVIEATSLAVHHVLEAVPQIALHKDTLYQQEISTGKSFGNERERHVVIDADYEVLNQLMGSKSLIDAKSQQRLAHAELLLQQIKHQMKQMKRAELEQQAQARVQTQAQRPAGKELAAAQPERGAKTTAQTPAKTSASKSQPSKTKEPSKSRDMER